MTISVFTPSHDPRYLDDCYRSLARQSFQDWEWVVVLNGGARDWRPPERDDRVHVSRGRFAKKVGAAKQAACALCAGEILFELDHDDTLTTDCLQHVFDAFGADSDAALVYSDFTQVNEDLTPNRDRFDESMGWVYTEEDIDGVAHLRCHSLAPHPHNVAYIWYAPNHLRAYRRSAYLSAGGYNPELGVLDDQDLMVRLHEVGSFHHIDRCLYLQRVHRSNTQKDPKTNAFIQEQTVRIYDLRIEDLVRSWCRREGLAAVTVRTSSVSWSDSHDGCSAVLDPTDPKLAFDDGSVGLIVASELLQRIPDRAAFFNECYRVLAHGGLIITRTPSTDGRGAFQDPSHIAFYNENSFWYLTQAKYRSSLPALDARLQVSRIRTYFPSQWELDASIPYVEANLLAVKDGPRLGGPLLC